MMTCLCTSLHVEATESWVQPLLRLQVSRAKEKWRSPSDPPVRHCSQRHRWLKHCRYRLADSAALQRCRVASNSDTAARTCRNACATKQTLRPRLGVVWISASFMLRSWRKRRRYWAPMNWWRRAASNCHRSVPAAATTTTHCAMHSKDCARGPVPACLIGISATRVGGARLDKCMRQWVEWRKRCVLRARWRCCRCACTNVPMSAGRWPRTAMLCCTRRGWRAVTRWWRSCRAAWPEHTCGPVARWREPQQPY